MKWTKKGLIYCPTGKHEFDFSHCHKPTPIILDDTTLRIFFGVRDKRGITRTTFVDVESRNPSKIKYIHDKPVFDIGKVGAFDDSGANVSSIIKKGNVLYMYYIGWNPSTTVHTRNSIGVVISNDNGYSFNRVYDGSILDRNKLEPYYTGAVDVLHQDNIWKIWYTSGSEWKIINNKPEICYHIKYGYSYDGIDWIREDVSCILPENEFEATARPCVLFEDNKFKMFYSKRQIVDFRTNKINGYRAGYAESYDGIIWSRLDHLSGIEVSENGWDSDSIAYPYVIKVNGKYLMFYNGNGFGKTGFGFAEFAAN